MEKNSWEDIDKMEGLLRINGIGSVYLYSEADYTIIEVFWHHQHGFKHNGRYILDDRLIVKTGRYEDYKEFFEETQMKIFNIKKYKYVAVNWHENNYRILYRLNYDPDTKEFSKEVLKLPLQGQRLMTLEERKPFLDSELV